MEMTATQIEALFTRSDGHYFFARWNRPIAPVVFGVEPESLGVLKGAIEAVVALAGHEMAETDPELGSNFMLFFIQDWQELLQVPGLARLIPDLEPLVDRLEQAKASQYRAFRFDRHGGIKACFAFVRMTADMVDIPAEDMALTQAVQAILLWSDQAFSDRSPLARAGGKTILRPEIAAVIRAGYDRVMPVASDDTTHALRLTARVAVAYGVSGKP